jgi:hypothetical protein
MFNCPAQGGVTSGLRSRRGGGSARYGGASDLRLLEVCCQCVSCSGLSKAAMGSFSFRFHALAVVLTYPGPLGRSQRLKQRLTPLMFTTTLFFGRAFTIGREKLFATQKTGLGSPMPMFPPISGPGKAPAHVSTHISGPGKAPQQLSSCRCRGVVVAPVAITKAELVVKAVEWAVGR